MLKNLVKKLPVVREIRMLRTALNSIASVSENLQQEHSESFLCNIFRSEKYQDAARVTQAYGQVYSQSGEDGIIAELFRRIGTSNKVFLEIGVGDGLENNTACLLEQGWSGFWVEGSPEQSNRIRSTFRRVIETKQLQLKQGFVTSENIVDLLTEMDVPNEFDLLSVDIDMNTFWVWQALRNLRPRVVVVEYNATWLPSMDWRVPYDPRSVWDGSMRFGASLKAFENLGRELGYALVGCDIGGVNAFFVRDDLLKDQFAAPFTAENHYEPARYWLYRRNGYPRAFR